MEDIVAAGVYTGIHEDLSSSGVIKAYCACGGKLGNLELNVCFPTPQSVSSSLHVKE